MAVKPAASRGDTVFNQVFDEAAQREARRFNKRMFYSALYGSESGFQEMEDFFIAYAAGGPLDWREQAWL